MSIYKHKFLRFGITFFLILALTLIAWQSASADGEATLTVESKNDVHPGDTISLSVTIPENLNISAMEFWLCYDSTQLLLTKVSSGSVLDGISGGQSAIFSPLDSQEPEPEGFICFQWDSTKSAVSASGSVLEVTFQVKENASDNISVTLQDAFMYDSDMRSQNVNCVNGVVAVSTKPKVTVYNYTTSDAPATLTEPTNGWDEGENTFSLTNADACVVSVSTDGGTTTSKLKATLDGSGNYNYTIPNLAADAIIKIAYKGDLNGDGKVTLLDLVRLLKSLVGHTVEMSYDGDITNDSKVNAQDMLRLMKYITGYDVVIN